MYSLGRGSTSFVQLVLTCINSSFLFIAESCPVGWMCPLTHEHEGCFQSWVGTNRVAMSFHLHLWLTRGNVNIYLYKELLGSKCSISSVGLPWKGVGYWGSESEDSYVFAHPLNLGSQSWRSGVVFQWGLSLLRDTFSLWQGFPYLGGHHNFLGPT